MQLGTTIGIFVNEMLISGITLRSGEGEGPGHKVVRGGKFSQLVALTLTVRAVFLIHTPY